jgi:hypothetical protein
MDVQVVCSRRMKLLRRSLFLLIAGMTLVGSGLACGLSATSSRSAAPSAPQPTQTVQAHALMPVAATSGIKSFPLVVSTPTAAPRLAIPETRRLTLEYPPHVRVGDSDVIRLTLEVDTLGQVTPTAEVQGNLVQGKIVQIPNVYDTHNVFAEARLDIAGLNIQPPDVQSESLTQGRPVTFYWSIQPINTGTFRGTVWFYLRFVDKVSGAESRQTVSAQPVQIDANNFFGFSGGFARIAGGLGSIMGAVLGFPFADDILKWLFNKLKNSK